jgi:hypothetical protein
MAAFRSGVVTELTSVGEDIVGLIADCDGRPVEVAAFPAMIGPLAVGDRLVLNTTGLDLNLGTGGVAFALWNLDGPGRIEPGPGHIVKLRYTPWQTEVLAAEAPESPHHEVLQGADHLDGMPVIACSLHSQIAGVAAGLAAANGNLRVGYLMTDGGALPLAWSKLIAALKEAGLIHVTCSAGHAFGGDLESVNIFSGLLALHHVGGADVVIVAMGPGVVGTGTVYGHTGVEQGQVLDAAYALGGRSVASLRISFVDERSRHLGVSHHTLAALGVVARERSIVAVPEFPPPRMAPVMEQLETAGIAEKHELRLADPGPGLRRLAATGLRPSSMGRSYEEVPELFGAATAAGSVGASLL